MRLPSPHRLYRTPYREWLIVLWVTEDGSVSIEGRLLA